jgi:hypothetical protein
MGFESFDIFVLKEIKVGEQINEFQVKINLFPSSFKRNVIERNFIFNISLKLCKGPEPYEGK